MFSTAAFQEAKGLFIVASIFGLFMLMASWNVCWLFYVVLILYVLSLCALIWIFRYPNPNPNPNPNQKEAGGPGLVAPCSGIVDKLDFDAASGRFLLTVNVRPIDQQHQYWPIGGIVQGVDRTAEGIHVSIRAEGGETVTVAWKPTFGARIDAVPGMPINAGDRAGMLKIGGRVVVGISRVHYNLLVKPGDVVHAMDTEIAMASGSKKNAGGLEDKLR
jgi:hypothetical protein